MERVALSTMWAQQQRFRSDLTSFAEIARAAGYSHIEVSHSTDEAGLRELMQQTVLPLSSLHAPTPLVQTSGRPNTELNLAGTDEAERIAAVQATHRTIELAGDCGAGSVVVHLGNLPRAVEADRELREQYRRGERSGSDVAAARQRAATERAVQTPAALDAARRSLRELVDHARRCGVRLGVETRMWFHELPLPEEAVALLAEHDPAVAGYWHDVGHAEILDRLGLVAKERWPALLGDRLIGCHLHDMQGITDHRAPGLGDVDWAGLSAPLRAVPQRTLEINQHQPEASLAEALTVLRRAGVLGE